MTKYWLFMSTGEHVDLEDIKAISHSLNKIMARFVQLLSTEEFNTAEILEVKDNTPIRWTHCYNTGYIWSDWEDVHEDHFFKHITSVILDSKQKDKRND